MGSKPSSWVSRVLKILWAGFRLGILALGIMVLCLFLVLALDLDSVLRFLWRLTDKYMGIDPAERSAFRLKIYIGFLCVWGFLCLIQIMNHFSPHNRRKAANDE